MCSVVDLRGSRGRGGWRFFLYPRDDVLLQDPVQLETLVLAHRAALDNLHAVPYTARLLLVMRKVPLPRRGVHLQPWVDEVPHNLYLDRLLHRSPHHDSCKLASPHLSRLHNHSSQLLASLLDAREIRATARVRNFALVISRSLQHLSIQYGLFYEGSLCRCRGMARDILLDVDAYGIAFS